MIKFIIGKYDEFQFYTGESYDSEAGMAFSYTMEGETDPTILFFNDGCKIKKL